MKHCKQIVVAALALGASLIPHAPAAPATQPVEEVIAHLGDPDPAIREQALRALREAGSSARPALEAAAKGDDPEIAARAREMLRTTPADPAAKRQDADETLPLILQYRTTPQEAKRAQINNLATTPEGLRALTRIWLTEADAELRGAIFDQLVSELSTSTAALLADGSQASAELLLQAAVDRKTADSPRAYAAYWLSRGKIDEPIHRWSSRGGQQPPDAWAEQVLAALYRAKGDAQSALLHARAADDADVLRETLVWAGDWRGLAAQLRHDVTNPQGPRDLALLCGADAFAGDEKSLSADVAQLIALAHGEEPAGAAGDILLLLNRPDDAVKVLVDNRQYYAAYEILDDRGKFDDAAALLAAHDDDKSEMGMLLRASAAKEFARLGMKARCSEMLDRLATENAAGKSARVFVAMGEARRASGMADVAWDYFFTAIEASGENGQQPWYVARAFPARGNDIDWSGIWTAAASSNPQRPVKAMFDRIRHAYDGSMSLDELVAAMKTVDLSNAVFHPYEELMADVARQLRAAGREEEAVKLLEELAQNAADGQLYLVLGDWASGKGDWKSAADRYETAWKKDRTRALPLYLLANALEHLGRAADARDRAALAHALSVGDEARRVEVIQGLAERGFDDAAAREADVLIRTGSPLTSNSQEALRTAAGLADDRHDFATAAALWQHNECDYLAGSYWFEGHSQYLHMPNSIEDSRARATIAAGDWAGAQGAIDKSLQMLPIDSLLAIDVVPELEKAGRKSEADAIFDKMYATQQVLCKKFPDSAFQLNECAWLAAKCHRHLDDAIATARRAVELDPKTGEDRGVDAIDTLAEAYFQRGDFEQAVAEEKKCIALAPTAIFHQRQLARFEAAMKKN